MVVLEKKIQRQPPEGFSWEFLEISKNTFFTEHLQTTASEVCYVWYILKVMIELKYIR